MNVQEFLILGVIVFAMCVQAKALNETLPPLKDGRGPETLEALWAGFDPRAEPLDVEVLKTWEQDGVVLQVLRYRIGVFKGQKAMMAAVYGYPKGARNVPGLVQIHGGGQYAHSNACLTNAKRGYATISISWAGRISAADYHVNPGVVKLFWDGKTNDPAYKLTTDWGALDGYHAPFRYVHGFNRDAPHEHSLDSVDSARNDAWFLCTLGARRALTFLEQQPEVDGDTLGVYGHSMGGKLTVLTAGADDRVKAAAPSCGGVSDRKSQSPTQDHVNLAQMRCPIFFLSPANDFHGRIEDLQTSLDEIQSEDWRITCAPHHQHQDTKDYEVATQLWFDQQLKGTFVVPATPKGELTIETANGVPSFSVTPDTSLGILSVDVFYTRQAAETAADRFWHHCATVKNGDTWTAPVPLLGTDNPLWVYANVQYALDAPVSGAGYYYGNYTTESFVLSTRMTQITSAALGHANIASTMKPAKLIEDFQGDWQKEWFMYSNDPATWWKRTTRKVHDDLYRAPQSCGLAFDARVSEPNILIVGLDGSGAEILLKGGEDWQSVLLHPQEFADGAGKILADWENITELTLTKTMRLKVERGADPVVLGSEAWKGDAPEFRNLRWVK